MKKENLGHAKCTVRQMQREMRSIQYELDCAATLLDTVGDDCNADEFAQIVEEIRECRKYFNTAFRSFQSAVAE